MRDLKFGDGDGPNICRVKKVDVSSTFIENIFRSGLTLVSSNDTITVSMPPNNLHPFSSICSNIHFNFNFKKEE